MFTIHDILVSCCCCLRLHFVSRETYLVSRKTPHLSPLHLFYYLTTFHASRDMLHEIKKPRGASFHHRAIEFCLYFPVSGILGFLLLLLVQISFIIFYCFVQFFDVFLTAAGYPDFDTEFTELPCNIRLIGVNLKTSP